MSGEPWSKFFWKDWESDPALKLCSLAAQGLWLRLLCIAASSTIKGEVRIGRRPCSVEDISRLIGIKQKEASALIVELENNGVFDRADDGAIVSRRMVRDAGNHEDARRFGKSGGRPKSRKNKENQYNPPLSKNKTPRACARAASASASASASACEGKGVQGGREPTGWAEWWGEYPHKVGKRDADREYRLALQRASAAELLIGLRRYIATKPRDRPWCNPATWLHQDRWLDEPAFEGINGHAQAGRPSGIENLFAGADAAARKYERAATGDRGSYRQASVPLLDEC